MLFLIILVQFKCVDYTSHTSMLNLKYTYILSLSTLLDFPANHYRVLTSLFLCFTKHLFGPYYFRKMASLPLVMQSWKDR